MEEHEELVTVSVNVPRGRLGDLYRYVAELNEGGLSPSAPGATSAGIKPWDADDIELATQLYGTVSENARRILDELTPDVVHVLVDGRIVASGGDELASRLEHDGYDAWRN